MLTTKTDTDVIDNSHLIVLIQLGNAPGVVIHSLHVTFDQTSAFFVIIVPICLSPSHPPPAQKLGQMRRQWQYQREASHTLAPCMQPLNMSRCDITCSGCSSAPRTPAPERGTNICCGTSITHSPQRPVPQNPHKNAPVPLAALGPPTTVCRSSWAVLDTVKSEQHQRWLRNSLLKSNPHRGISSLLRYCGVRLGVLFHAKGFSTVQFIVVVFPKYELARHILLLLNQCIIADHVVSLIEILF